MVRSFSRLADPIDTVQHKVTSPIRPDTDVSILWVGHATMIIQIRDKVFVTDPNFTNTVGMVAKRVIEPGLDPSTISHVDYTLISHTHFDHFSYGSLDMLPQNGALLVPLGALAYTPDFDYPVIREMQPWEVFEEDGVRITAVPVQHFSGRYGVDILWMRDRGYTGYVIEYAGYTIFFGGDTGYHPGLFKEIGRRFSVDIAILPIAPIAPRDFMQRYHVDPAEALQIFEDVKAGIMVPMHHRTYAQGLDPTITYPQELLLEAARERNMTERVTLLDIGEQRVFFARDDSRRVGSDTNPGLR